MQPNNIALILSTFVFGVISVAAVLTLILLELRHMSTGIQRLCSSDGTVHVSQVQRVIQTPLE